MRKFNIADLIEIVNRRNKHSTCPKDVREGWNALLEEILHKNDVYAGYGYYPENEVPKGEKPGIIRSESGTAYFPDETRRFYYIQK